MVNKAQDKKKLSDLCANMLFAGGEQRGIFV